MWSPDIAFGLNQNRPVKMISEEFLNLYKLVIGKINEMETTNNFKFISIQKSHFLFQW